VSEPIPSIVTVMTSPGLRKTGSGRKAPTPSGVPVLMTSPSSRVMRAVMNAISYRTPKIMIRVLLSCIRCPLRSQVMARFCGSGISLAGTNTGPHGPKVS
jgi:hypothetical protein